MSIHTIRIDLGLGTAAKQGAAFMAAIGSVVAIMLIGFMAPAPALVIVCVAQLLAAMTFAMVRSASPYFAFASGWAIAMMIPISAAICRDVLPGSQALVASAACMALVGLMAIRLRPSVDLGPELSSPVSMRLPAALLIAVVGGVLLATIGIVVGAGSTDVTPDPGASRTLLAAVAALHGVTVEIVFRGLILWAIAPILGTRALGVAATALLGAAVGIGPGTSLGGLLLLIILGALMGLVMVRSRSVVGVSAGHAAFAVVAAWF